MTDVFADTLRSASSALGVPLSDAQIDACERYADLMLAYNTHTNLTRIVEPQEIAVKHFADSLTLLKACSGIAPQSRLCDVGTGAGFPGLAVKIARPDLRLTLVDSLAKRLTFLEQVVEALALTDVTLVHARAEEMGRDPVHRDQYNVVTARAVAALPVLLEWCGPLVRPLGRFVALKTPGVSEELPLAEKAGALLNLRLEKDVSFVLPDAAHEDAHSAESAQRRVLVYRKTDLTPPRFPRRAGEIKARSLGAAASAAEPASPRLRAMGRRPRTK